jgi:fatty acid desaturase
MPFATVSDEVDPVTVSDPTVSFDQIRACLGIDRETLRDLVGDLYRHSAVVYWSDLVLSLAIGYGAFALLPMRNPFSVMGAALYCVSVFACYRAIIFTHELAHKPLSKFPIFRLAWDVFCGTPVLLPSYFYDEHRAHHAKRTYGTSRDGEYLAYARLPVRHPLLLIGISPLIFPALVFRFLILTPLLLVSFKVRSVVLTRASSLVIDPDHRRTVAGENMPTRWICQELACFGWCVLVSAGLAVGFVEPSRLVEAAAIMTGIFALNALRTLVAHKYAGGRHAMEFHEQVLDSNDFPGPLAELWAPLGLRFHAVHHLLPNLPYHSLRTAHRRLIAAIPPDGPFRACQHRSLISAIRAAIELRRRFSYPFANHVRSSRQTEEHLLEATAMNAGHSAVTVVPVEGRALKRAFHHLPYMLYKDDPNWVAPLLLERRIHFDKSHNPFFQHAKATYWLAYRDGVPVGRITAQIDALHLARYNDATGHFGFIEGIDDPSVFEALLGTAESWLRSEGMRRSVGPVSFSMWDEPGLLVDGFNTPPAVLMGHALPYYQKHIAAQGYAQVQDLLAYDYQNGLPLPPTMERIIARSQEKHQFRFRPIRMDRKNFTSEVALLLDILNDAWSDNWGFVAMTQAEIDDMASIFKFLLRPDAVVFAEYDGEAAGFALTLPNINEAISDLNGRLLPSGFAKLFWRLKISGIRSGRMALMGVRRKWQNSHIGAVLALSIIQHTRKSHFARGVTRGELSWLLDSNERTKHMLTLVGGTVYKRYRIYEKPLS